MKNLFSLALLSLCFVSSLSQAQDQGPLMLDGTDIRPLVNHLGQKIRTLDKPVTIFNWSPNGGLGEAGFQGKAELWSQTFWRNYGQKEGSMNMYGAGLYGAVDPVVTAGYGMSYSASTQKNWLLLEMQLPAGFRLADVHESYTGPQSLPEELQKIALAFNCPKNLSSDLALQNGGASLDPKCRILTQKIYKDILKIDGLAYMYSAQPFKECKNSYEVNKAFVITRPDWIKPELIRYYNADTKNHLQDRIRIQTLFLKSKSDSLTSNFDHVVQPIGQYLSAHPKSQLKSSKTKCENQFCVITVQFCEAQNVCEEIALPAIPRPGGPLITAQEAQSATPYGLLWADLEGQPKSTTVSTWLKENRYACSGQLPYKQN